MVLYVWAFRWLMGTLPVRGPDRRSGVAGFGQPLIGP
jgi:hypothetical protein